MKQWIAVLVLVLGVPKALAEEQRARAVKKIQSYGPPVKLDISGNECIKKGESAYIRTLFYEEFKTLAECRAAIERRS